MSLLTKVISGITPVSRNAADLTLDMRLGEVRDVL